MNFLSKYKQFIKFCVVGALNTLLDICLYALFHQVLNVASVIASTLTVLLVITFSYLLNSFFVFKSKPSLLLYVKFVVTTGLGIALIQGLLSGLLEPQLNSSRAVNIGSDETNTFLSNSLVRVSGTFISLIWNYLFYKYFVFKITSHAHKNSELSSEVVADK